MPVQLSDLQKLMQEPSRDVRVEVAEKVASGYTEGSFTNAEKAIAIEIFRILVNDAEMLVRRMLSEHLARSLDAPHDVILKLANDEAQVAVHVLEHSYVLTEDDLIAITRSTEDLTIMATIARRETVSRELSAVLLKKSNPVVLETLLRNKSASIGESDLTKIVQESEGNASILELLVKRGGLPLTLAERLFTAVSDEMKKVLVRQYKLTVQMADESTKDVRELATLGLVDTEMQAMDIAKLVNQLYQQGRLTLSIIIRSLCLGDMRFFEYALAKLADVPVTNVQLLVLDQGETGFAQLYKTSCLPMELFQATNYLLKIALEETSFGRYQRSDFKQRLANRLMRDDTARKIEYMDYLLTLINSNARDITFTG